MEHFVGQYDIGRKCFLVGKAFAESAESLEKFPTSVLGNPNGNSLVGTVALRLRPLVACTASSRRMVTSRARALPNKTSVPL